MGRQSWWSCNEQTQKGTPLAAESVLTANSFLQSQIEPIEEGRSFAYTQFDSGNRKYDIAYSDNISLRYANWQLAATDSNFFGPKTSIEGLFEGKPKSFILTKGRIQHNGSDLDWEVQSGHKDLYRETTGNEAKASPEIAAQEEALGKTLS